MSVKRKYGIESEKVDREDGRIQAGFKGRKFDARGNFHVLRLTDARKRLRFNIYTTLCSSLNIILNEFDIEIEKAYYHNTL